jgi:hypothetical protein
MTNKLHQDSLSLVRACVDSNWTVVFKSNSVCYCCIMFQRLLFLWCTFCRPGLGVARKIRKVVVVVVCVCVSVCARGRERNDWWWITGEETISGC